jgi:uncharacterized protein YaaR (DUF327 family)
MSIETANAIIDQEIEEAQDKRVKRSFSNIKQAANEIHGQKKDITIVSLGEYITDNGLKSPTTRTMYNDKRYEQAINSFIALNRGGNKASPKNTDKNKNIPAGTLIEIANLKKKVKVLSNIINKNFAQQSDTGLISLDEIIKHRPESGDDATLFSAKGVLTQTQTKAIQTIFNTLLEVENAIELTPKGASQRLIDKDTKQSVLNPTELKALLSLIE